MRPFLDQRLESATPKNLGVKHLGAAGGVEASHRRMIVSPEWHSVLREMALAHFIAAGGLR